MSKAHRIVYTPEATDHLAQLRAHERAAVIDNVDRKLVHEPTVPTRNRKVLQASPVAPYELRVGTLRVFYEVREDEQGPLLLIKAVGVKHGDVLTIGGVEIKL